MGRPCCRYSPPLVVPARGAGAGQCAPGIPYRTALPGGSRGALECGAEARTGHEFAAQPASLQDLYGDNLGMKAAETLPSRESRHDPSEP